MAVTSDRQFSGSVSGGCVENAVIEVALDVLKTGQAQLLHFGVADEVAWQVGLACGGTIEVFVQPLEESFFTLLRDAWLDEDAPSVHITTIHGAEPILGRAMLLRENGVVTGTLGNHYDESALELAREGLMHGKSQRTLLDEETELFLEYIAPAPALIVVGGVHITVALLSLAKTLGFRTVLIDPRSVWGRAERFPGIDHLIRAWPQDAFQEVKITPSTAIIMLTHDPKLDDRALKIALNSPAFYVGALGSRTTNAKRHERLLQAGLTEGQWSRLHAPIGLDIGAETPEEIALAILAEVVETYRKRNPEPAEVEANLGSKRH